MTEDIIRLLPDSVANQIAAGEVIQRPASVIKELVENAIDAGATAVQIVLKDAGKTLIQVIDNGCGMSTTDARLAFERHATSKIRKADDLFTLHTMGFRGEALPSIAAVSEVEMRTMRPEDSIGTELHIRASDVVSQEPCVCMRGTNIMVRNLFYNFVARRRFLKKDAQEMTHIMHEFERLALVNTNVEFSLTHNGQLVHQMLQSPLKKRIGALFGKTVEQGIIPLETSAGIVKISGYIGLPEAARRRGALQYFFVNGRNMRHPYFHRAVLNCYKDLISADVQPNYFISFELEPDRIDVNIHPQKHEIKFEDEQLVFQILTAAIKESLGKFNVGPSIDFDASDVPDIPPCVPREDVPVSPVSDELDPSYNPFDDLLAKPENIPVQSRIFTGNSGRASALNRNTRDWDKLYDSFLSKTGDNSETAGGNDISDSVIEDDAIHGKLSFDDNGHNPSFDKIAENHGFSRDMIQCRGRYLVTDSKSGLMFIDQHRANVLILYTSILEKLDGNSLSSQYLLIEESVELDAAASAIAAGNISTLEEIGFHAEREGSSAVWVLKAIPSVLGPASAAETFRSVIADIAEETACDSDKSAWHRHVALSLAKASAMRGNTRLTPEEMERLVTDLFRLPAPGYTPDGLPVIRIMGAEDITRLFNR